MRMEIYYARKTKVDRLKLEGYKVSAKQDRLDLVKLEKESKKVEVVATDKDVLVAKAKELGINANKKWGIPKLTEAIAEAEKGDEKDD